MYPYQRGKIKTPEIFRLIDMNENEKAKEYFNKNPQEIQLQDKDTMTPLHVAAWSGNIEMVKFLVKKKANVNSQSKDYFLPPVYWTDDVAIVRYLVDHGAHTYKLLELASSKNKIEIVDFLLSKGERINKSNPEYLQCRSDQCIMVYIKHHVKIDGCDEKGENLLHKLASQGLIEVFDFAYSNGCPWQNNIGGYNPYYLARFNHKAIVLKHFRENYAELISHPKIEYPTRTNYEYEPIRFLKQSPTNSYSFFGLTNTAKIIRYVQVKGEISIDRIAVINAAGIENFTFDQQGNIVIPTFDNELLIVDQVSLRFIHSIDLPDGLTLHNISYLPLKNVYISGFSGSCELLVLSDDYKITGRAESEWYPHSLNINHNENLISGIIYHQGCDTVELYYLESDFGLTFIENFVTERSYYPSGYTHLTNSFFVSSPSEIECYTFEKKLDFYPFGNELLKKHWSVDISKYTPEISSSYLVSFDENIIIAGKGKRLLFVNTNKRSIVLELELDLMSEISCLYIDEAKEHLIVTTLKELKMIVLNEISFL